MKKYISAGYVALLAALMPLFAYAQGIVPCGPEEGREPCTVSDFFVLLVNIFNYLLSIGAIVAFMFLIYGGIKMFLYSVDEEQLASSKKTVVEALIGLAIILLAYVLVNTLLNALGISDTAQYFNGDTVK